MRKILLLMLLVFMVSCFANTGSLNTDTGGDTGDDGDTSTPDPDHQKIQELRKNFNAANFVHTETAYPITITENAIFMNGAETIGTIHSLKNTNEFVIKAFSSYLKTNIYSGFTFYNNGDENDGVYFHYWINSTNGGFGTIANIDWYGDTKYKYGEKATIY